MEVHDNRIIDIYGTIDEIEEIYIMIVKHLIKGYRILYYTRGSIRLGKYESEFY